MAEETNGNGKWKDRIITWLIAGLLAYGTMHARVAVMESQMDTLRDDVREIKNDVKALLQRP